MILKVDIRKKANYACDNCGYDKEKQVMAYVVVDTRKQHFNNTSIFGACSGTCAKILNK